MDRMRQNVVIEVVAVILRQFLPMPSQNGPLPVIVAQTGFRRTQELTFAEKALFFSRTFYSVQLFRPPTTAVGSLISSFNFLNVEIYSGGAFARGHFSTSLSNRSIESHRASYRRRWMGQPGRQIQRPFALATKLSYVTLRTHWLTATTSSDRAREKLKVNQREREKAKGENKDPAPENGRTGNNEAAGWSLLLARTATRMRKLHRLSLQ